MRTDRRGLASGHARRADHPLRRPRGPRDRRRPRTGAGRGPEALRRLHGRHQLRRHPPDRELLPRRPAAADDPRRRVRRHARRRRPARGRPARRRRVRGEGRRAGLPHLAGARTASATSRPSPSSSRAPRRGTCCAPAPTWPRASPSSSSPAPAASARSPSSWPAAGAPAGSSPRRPARRSASSPRSSARTPPSTRPSPTTTRRPFTGALREANGGRPVDIVLEMTGGNVFAGSLSALAPFGRLCHLRDGRPPGDEGRCRPAR